jgi:hypothetical protein
MLVEPFAHDVRMRTPVFGDANDNLIDRTIALWQPRLQRKLSREDARQIAENVTGFFSILHEWSRVNVPAPNNDNCGGSGSDKPGRPKTQGSGS